MTLKSLFLSVCTLLLPLTTYANGNNTQSSENIKYIDGVIEDYSHFYTLDTLVDFSLAFGLGAAMAHSAVDEEFQGWYQDDIRSSTTDDLASVAKVFGEKTLMVPVAAALVSLPWYMPVKSDSSIVKWSNNMMRTYTLGLPLMLVAQKATGASRPDEQAYGSEWRPGNDKNGVSGHSFGGAVPFLNAAFMYKENSWQRNSLLFVSTLTGWSRVNDNDHYLSQALLGWYLAYKTTQAIFETNNKYESKNALHVYPVMNEKIIGLQLAYRW
ncbi:phosphatase PAP2 family protein [Colwelliaceae bacterium 6441]